MINEGIVWVKNGKRSEWSDLVVIAFLFITVYLFTKQDMLTSLIGAFSIYLLFGIAELKDYEVLNKILLITAITYLVIFIAGIIGTFLNMTVIRDTAFSMSFWLILILGFAFFGRKIYCCMAIHVTPIFDLSIIYHRLDRGCLNFHFV